MVFISSQGVLHTIFLIIGSSENGSALISAKCLGVAFAHFPNWINSSHHTLDKMFEKAVLNSIAGKVQ